MRKLIGSAVLVAAVCAIPASAHAQRRAAAAGGPKHEFGIDAVVAYSKPEGADGQFSIFTPVDIRVGFMTAKKMMWESHLGLFFTSGGVDGYDISVGLNAVTPLGRGTHRSGPYWTAGAAINLVDDGTDSGAILSLNGGVGKRSPYGSGASRLTGFVSYSFENTSLAVPSILSFGARIGLSLWH